MPTHLRLQDPVAVADALARDEHTRADLKLLSKHFLAVLSIRAPGHSVEVRVPPYAAAQVIPGVRHTRGTPPAVVELDGPTWVALATGRETWAEAMAEGRIHASGQRADLTPYLPLTEPPAEG